ncbi:unnamed protein product [Callosobruchus maculatus]|uniref:Uncharacterized protein n=1 Tax=Callosobruchus maculatus TaxID=64391 RepID=A0A653CWG5_CALMS|nr:unnamed protein product [Callosobruchus maculatus]
MDPSDEVILSIVDPSTVVGDKNEFDSDNLFINKKVDTHTALEYELNLSTEQKDFQDNPPISIDEETIPEVVLFDDNDITAQSVTEECEVEASNAISSDLGSNAHAQSKPPPRKSNFARRRPTATVVRSLASSTLAEQYQQLAEKKMLLLTIL